jgi:uncharacterized protein (DUF697 family)/uncharacterized tellurite resistance protein B-like protein
MTEQEQHAIMTLVLMAAFADGRNDETERAEVNRITASLSRDHPINAAALYQDVLLKQASVERAAAALTTPEVKRLAYELCVGVCDADGAQNDAERAFLSAVRTSLGFDAATEAAATAFTSKADALAVTPLAAVSRAEPAPANSTMTAEEQDRMILNYAILNGALELLPDSLATMAIVPLQMKMVYRIGRSYGFELDRAHIGEFLATGGVGMASQFVEQIGVKLVSRILGRGIVGGLLGAAAGQSISSGFSFATTYALGRLATKYYAGGRTLSAQLMKETYEGLLAEARSTQGQYLPAIQEKARTLNVTELLETVRRP